MAGGEDSSACLAFSKPLVQSPASYKKPVWLERPPVSEVPAEHRSGPGFESLAPTGETSTVVHARLESWGQEDRHTCRLASPAEPAGALGQQGALPQNMGGRLVEKVRGERACDRGLMT